MARFRFEYEAVLRARKAEEERHQRAVGELERRRVALDDRVRRCERHLADERMSLRRQLTPGATLDVRGVRQQAVHGARLDRERRELAVALAGVLARLERARGLLREAAGRRKAMEVLRDKRYEQFLAKQRRTEANELDEIVTMRHGRTTQEIAA